MRYLEIKNIEKYNPGFKDRILIWGKFYFSMLNSDHIFEMIPEIDKWRYIAFVMLQLQTKEPVPLDTKYLKRKGFDLQKRRLATTLYTLRELITVNNGTNTQKPVTQSRVEYNRVEKSRVKKKLVTFKKEFIKNKSI